MGSCLASIFSVSIPILLHVAAPAISDPVVEAHNTIVRMTEAGDIDRDGVGDLLVEITGQHNCILALSGRGGSVLHVFAEPQSLRPLLRSQAANAGDVDGDGHADVLLSWMPYRSQSPVVEVRSGTTGASLFELVDREHAMTFGDVIASAGDVDGDGRCDLLVGAPHANADSGEVCVFSGRDGHLLRTHDGEARSRLGSSVVGIGDFDGDGCADYAVGAPAHPNRSATHPRDTTARGAIYIYSGKSGERIASLTPASTRVEGFERIGRRIGAAGDWDGDGKPDLLIAQVEYSSFFSSQGSDDESESSSIVSIVSGKTGLSLRTFRISDASMSAFGYSAAVVGDANGDRVSDVAIGDPEWDIDADVLSSRSIADTPLEGRNWSVDAAEVKYTNNDKVAHTEDVGCVRLFSGRDGSVLHIWTGHAAHERVGMFVVRAGDVDGDGTCDLWIGSTRRMQLCSGKTGKTLLGLGARELALLCSK